jgi:hypothetical protein
MCKPFSMYLILLRPVRIVQFDQISICGMVGMDTTYAAELIISKIRADARHFIGAPGDPRPDVVIGGQFYLAPAQGRDAAPPVVCAVDYGVSIRPSRLLRWSS